MFSNAEPCKESSNKAKTGFGWFCNESNQHFWAALPPPLESFTIGNNLKKQVWRNCAQFRSMTVITFALLHRFQWSILLCKCHNCNRDAFESHMQWKVGATFQRRSGSTLAGCYCYYDVLLIRFVPQFGSFWWVPFSTFGIVCVFWILSVLFLSWHVYPSQSCWTRRCYLAFARFFACKFCIVPGARSVEQHPYRFRVHKWP